MCNTWSDHWNGISSRASASILDLGPNADRGIGEYPPVEGDVYPSLVSTVDEDLNETAGIKLPDITVPVGTHTGWNAGDPETGEPRVASQFLGITRYFAQDEDRRADGDARAPIAARYANREAYLAQVRDEAQRLVEASYILPEDVALVVSNCADRYDEALKIGASDP